MSLDGFRHSDYVCSGNMCWCWSEFRKYVRQRMKEDPFYIPPKEFLKQYSQEWSKEEHIQRMEKEKEKRGKYSWEEPFKKILGIKDKKPKRLTTIEEHKEALITYFTDRIDDCKTLFELRQYLLEQGICPRCGIWISSYSSSSGHRCHNCGFVISEDDKDFITSIDVEDEDINNELKKAKNILLKRLKQK